MSVGCLDAGVAFLVSESREVMNVRQASQYLGISPDTLYRYITEGEIPAFKLGNRWKLRKTILDRWMEARLTKPPPSGGRLGRGNREEGAERFGLGKKSRK